MEASVDQESLSEQPVMPDHLVVVAYAVDPGPGGPESHVNAEFLRALARYWIGGVTVITAGESPCLEGAKLSDLQGWKVITIPESGTSRLRLGTSLISYLANLYSKRGSVNAIADVMARAVNRLVYLKSGQGLKAHAWITASAPALWRELRSHPGSLVFSRALPFGSIAAAAAVRKESRFTWIVNINDPLPAGIWPGLYAADELSDRRITSSFKKIVPLVDAFTFPSSDLRDLEIEAFPDIAKVPTRIFPHIVRPYGARMEAQEALRGLLFSSPSDEQPLKISFAGTLRKTRIRPELREALTEFAGSSSHLAQRTLFSFHLARPNPFAEEFIKSLPIRTEVTVGEFDDVLEQRLLNADILLDMEASEDKPLLLTKVVNYLGAGKPIWAICELEGTTWRIINEHRCGYVTPIGNPSAIINTLCEIHRDHSEGKLVSKLPDSLTLERFSGERQVDELLKLYAQVRR